MGREAPADLVRYAAVPGLAHVLARAFDAQVVFPDQVSLAGPDLAPGLSGNHVWLMTENQGVCVWVVPLDAGDTPPVIVAGDLAVENGAPRVYARTLDDFAAAWAWDLQCLGRHPSVQAQAIELDTDTLAWLEHNLRAGTPTWGWPTRTTLRWSSNDGLTILLWDQSGQCDWFISAPYPDVLASWLERLLALSDLTTSLYANDDTAEELLRDAKRHS